MDGRGRCLDNHWIERFWHTLKTEYVDLHHHTSVLAMRQGIALYINDYNTARGHRQLNGLTPQKYYLRAPSRIQSAEKIIKVKSQYAKSAANRYVSGYYYTLVCAAPGQIYGREDAVDLIELDGRGLLFHPDLLIGTLLEKEISKFSFFDYSANEGLIMEDTEKEKLSSIVGNIHDEISNGIHDNDKDNIIVGYISTLLHYCNRFYNRQFSTLRKDGDDILIRLSQLINEYFNSGKQLADGLPGVAWFAEKMCMSPSYFSDILKKTTGESAGNFIRSHIIRIAKNRLVATGNVPQVAYDLRFDYPQHFSRMFKQHTGLTPKQYIKGFE